MASYEVEVTVLSAKDLKNVNWRNGAIRPYVVLWVDPSIKSSTKADEKGDTSPDWDETLVIPLPPSGRPEDSDLNLDIVHAGSEEDTKPLIGSAHLKLREVINDVGMGERATRTLKLKRPSGRPHGKVEVKVCVREPRYRSRDLHYAPPYGVPPPGSAYPPLPASAYSPPPAAAGYPYSQPPPYGYPYSQPPPPQPEGFGSQYGAPPVYAQHASAAQPAYAQQATAAQPAYAPATAAPVDVKKSSKFGGMGKGLAVGAVAGALGGLAIAGGAHYLEDKIEDKVDERVAEQLGYDDDDF